MDDLIAFLNARLDEDEAAAKAAKNVQTEWYVGCDDDTVTIDALREHIGRSSPARALREVEADRKLLAAYRKTLSTPIPEADDETGWRLAIEFAIKLRASIYGDHPDYQPEWGPVTAASLSG